MSRNELIRLKANSSLSQGRTSQLVRELERRPHTQRVLASVSCTLGLPRGKTPGPAPQKSTIQGRDGHMLVTGIQDAGQGLSEDAHLAGHQGRFCGHEV